MRYEGKKQNIHYHSDKAASIQTITGWVSSTGVYWGKDEHMARWSGCTHMTCQCGNVHEKGRTVCDECFHKRSVERFLAMPEKADTGDFLYSDAADRYFSEVSEAEDYAYDEGLTLHDLRLIICEPNIMKTVDDEHWDGDLPEDQYLEDCAPKAVMEKLRELNELIASMKPVLSWSPGKYRLSLADYSPRETAEEEAAS